MSKIDLNLYSRQVIALGKDGLVNMTESKIMVVGITGIGIELVKNLALFGFGTITMYETKKISERDITSNFFIKEENIGQNRAIAVVNNIRKLNPNNVNVNVVETMPSEEDVKNHDVIILCDQMRDDIEEIDEWSVRNSKKIIVANTFGVCGRVFNNFGKFKSNNITGNDKLSGKIIAIKEGHYVIDNIKTNRWMKYIGIIIGDEKKKERVMKIDRKFVYNGTKVIGILTNNKREDQERNDMRYIEILETKEYEQKRFIELTSEINNENKNIHDKVEMHRAVTLIEMYINNNGNYPGTVEVVLEESNIEVDNVTKEIMKKIIKGLGGKLCLLESVIGSICCNEAMKAVLNKFEIIDQFRYFDMLDIVTNDEDNEGKIGQTRILGTKFEENIKNQRVFIVGAGAIGCELAKYLSLMGFKKIIITDMDKIEKSNLNRQFLFDNEAIGKFKAEALKEAIQKQRNIEIETYTQKLDNTTIEDIFNMKFFNGIDGVITALDNVSARNLVSKLCVTYKKNMFDSGTEGTIGAVNPYIADKTITYNRQEIVENANIPMCTLKSYPYLIEHTIQWARDKYEEIFVEELKEYQNNYDNIDGLMEKNIEEVKKIVKKLLYFKKNRPSKNTCIKLGYEFWRKYYYEDIKKIQMEHPIDSKDDLGKDFWNGVKKYPKLEEFNKNEVKYQEMICAISNIYVSIFGLEKINTTDIIENEYEYKEEDRMNFETESIEEIVKKIKEIEFEKIEMKFEEFEKDSETNNHIEFITSASNLRAEIYGINTISKFDTKVIVGRIIPAIVTTTSIVASYSIYNYLCEMKKLEPVTYQVYLSKSIVLKYNQMLKINKNIYGRYEHNEWKVIRIESDTKIGKLLKGIGNIIGKENIEEIKSIYYGSKKIYSDIDLYLDDEERKKVLNKKLSESSQKRMRSMIFDMKLVEDEEEYNIIIQYVRREKAKKMKK